MKRQGSVNTDWEDNADPIRHSKAFASLGRVFEGIIIDELIDCRGSSTEQPRSAKIRNKCHDDDETEHRDQHRSIGGYQACMHAWQKSAADFSALDRPPAVSIKNRAVSGKTKKNVRPS